MILLTRRTASLQALRRKVPLDALPHVQPMFLLQMLIGFSQILNGGAARSEALARTLILDGQQRLCRLREVAPHLDLSLVPLLEKIRPSETGDEPFSDEERAVQAMLEMCLGLVLHWLSKRDDEFCPCVFSIVVKRLPVLDVVLASCFSSLHLLFRARSCLIV